jgi:hypothetical protein
MDGRFQLAEPKPWHLEKEILLKEIWYLTTK